MISQRGQEIWPTGKFCFMMLLFIATVVDNLESHDVIHPASRGVAAHTAVVLGQSASNSRTVLGRIVEKR